MRWILLVFILFAGCSGEKARSREVAAAPKKSQPVQTVPKVVDWRGALQAVLPEGALITLEDKSVSLVMTGEMAAEPFDKIVLLVAQTLVSKSVPATKIHLEAPGGLQTRITGQFYLRDAESFTRLDISQAEFLRRAQVTVLETVPSLKLKLVDARSRGDHTLAQALLERWLALEPESQSALALLGNVFRDAQRYLEAIENFKKLNPEENKEFVYWNLGYCYEKLGALNDAIASYKKVLDIKPTHPQVLRQLAQVYSKDADTARAKEMIELAKKQGASAQILLVEGNLERDLKAYKEAEAVYNQGIQAYPDDARFLFNLTLVQLDADKSDDAKKTFSLLQTKDASFAKELSDIAAINEVLQAP